MPTNQTITQTFSIELTLEQAVIVAELLHNHQEQSAMEYVRATVTKTRAQAQRRYEEVEALLPRLEEIHSRCQR